METIKQTVTLDLAVKTSPPIVHAKQGDKASREVICMLANQGVPYTPEEGVTANVALRKPDGMVVLNPATIEGTTAKFTLTQQMLIKSGAATCEIQLINADQLLSTAVLIVMIEPSACDMDAIESSPEYQTFVEALQRVIEMEGRIDTVIDRVNEAMEKIPDIQESIDTMAQETQNTIAATQAANEATQKALEAAAKAVSATIQVGTVTTGDPGTQASIENVGTENAAVFNFVIPKGDKGDTGAQGEPGAQGAPGTPGQDGAQGEKGDPGQAATVTVGTVSTGEPGTEASVTNAGDSSAAVFNFVIPRGEQGIQGIQGVPGEQGEPGVPGKDGTSFTVKGIFATLEELQQAHPTGEPGDAYAVGTDSDNVVYIWDETGAWKSIGKLQGLPGEDGQDGAPGADGQAATITVGEVVTAEPGTPASVENTGTENAAVLKFTIPKGEPGAQGEPGTPGQPGEPGTPGEPGADGKAATVTIGTVSTGEPGTEVQVTNSGDSTAAVFNFVIPRGAPGERGADGAKGEQGVPGEPGQDGAQGADGKAATITVGSVTTGEAGTNASVTNAGNENAAVLNFVIPRGAQGADGARGPQGEPGTPGADGHTPVKGTDYWTPEDRQGIIQELAGTIKKPLVKVVTLSSSGWVAGDDGLNRQTITVDGLTASDKVDFDTSIEYMDLLQDDIIPENNAGTLSAVTKTPPESDIQVQITVTAVEVSS